MTWQTSKQNQPIISYTWCFWNFKNIILFKYIGGISFVCCVLLTFTYPYMVEKMFLGQIFKIEILINIQVLRSPEFGNCIFSGWSVCVRVISITLKQIIAKTSNLVFYICIICWCYLKLFMKLGEIVCVKTIVYLQVKDTMETLSI